MKIKEMKQVMNTALKRGKGLMVYTPFCLVIVLKQASNYSILSYDESYNTKNIMSMQKKSEKIRKKIKSPFRNRGPVPSPIPDEVI
jgi:hypothetical protein